MSHSSTWLYTTSYRIVPHQLEGSGAGMVVSEVGYLGPGPGPGLGRAGACICLPADLRQVEEVFPVASTDGPLPSRPPRGSVHIIRRTFRAFGDRIDTDTGIAG